MKSLLQTDSQFSGSVYIGDSVNDSHIVNGSMNLGDASNGNYLAISSSGYISKYGNARSYNIIACGFGNFEPDDNSEVPTKTLYSGSMVWSYPKEDNTTLYYTITLGNDYAEGTNITPFINILTPSLAMDSEVNFQFSYMWQNSNSDQSSQKYFKGEYLFTIVGSEHRINRYDFDPIVGTGKKIGSILLFSLKRFVSSGRNSDTLNGPIYLINAGISYMSDSNGSRVNFSK